MRLVSDENFNREIVRGLLLRRPDLDLCRVQDVGLQEADESGCLSALLSPRRGRSRPLEL